MLKNLISEKRKSGDLTLLQLKKLVITFKFCISYRQKPMCMNLGTALWPDMNQAWPVLKVLCF
jgi:hypothetical protein